MGDAMEEIIAEPDNGGEGGQPPDMEHVHPPTLEQQNPWILRQFFHSFVALTSVGWYVLAAVLLGVVVWQKFKPRLMRWKRKKDEEREVAEIHKNPDIYIERERALEAARQRMQDEYIRTAAKHAERMKEVEEKKRQEKLEKMEAQLRGEGRSKSELSTPASSSSSSSPSSSKPSEKPRLRPDYNPMMGDGGACSWRPARRSGGG